MSADAWRVCPRCEVARQIELERLNKEVEGSYGNVPPEEFIRLMVENDKAQSDEAPITLREDYEIWMDEDGIFTIGYRSSCSVCKFEFNYKYSEKVSV